MFRRHGRTAMRCPMLLRHEHLGFLRVVTNNVSASGVFVGVGSASEDAWLPQMQVGDTLETEVESANDLAERMKLTVVRKSDDGFGLTFVGN
jgi:hypothetical protein